MHCVDFFGVVVFKILAFLYVFINLSVMGRYIKTKLKYVKNAHIFEAATTKKKKT